MYKILRILLTSHKHTHNHTYTVHIRINVIKITTIEKLHTSKLLLLEISQNKDVHISKNWIINTSQNKAPYKIKILMPLMNITKQRTRYNVQEQN